MNIRDIPWYIEGSDCAMLRVNPDDLVPANRPTVYVRLVDVLGLLPLSCLIVEEKEVSRGS